MNKLNFFYQVFSVLLFQIVIGGVALAEPPLFSETLKEAENTALRNSGLIKSVNASEQASASQTEASEGTLYPRLTLDGTYYYQTNVPQMAFGAPGSGSTLSFGDYNNYNIGPTLSFTLFDGGYAHGLWNSSKTLLKMKSEDSKLIKKQILFNTRLTYTKVQLNVKSLMLTSDSLKLSQSRERDIRNRFRAGASSRLDSVNAKREVLNYQLKFRQAQNNLASSVRDLLALTGAHQQFNLLHPWPHELAHQLPEGVEAPTFYIQVDSLNSSLKTIGKPQNQDVSEHPQIKSLAYGAEASKKAAEAQESVLWPKISVSARAEYMYPNGPVLQTAQQNIFSLSLTMPLFEGGVNSSISEQHNKEALGLSYQREQKIIDMERDQQKALDLMASLRAQQQLSRENVENTSEVARLTYQSYKAGKQQYLDVQTANLNLLEAQVAAAEIEANIINTISQLSYLSSQTEQ